LSTPLSEYDRKRQEAAEKEKQRFNSDIYKRLKAFHELMKNNDPEGSTKWTSNVKDAVLQIEGISVKFSYFEIGKLLEAYEKFEMIEVLTNNVQA
jgi:hypothetical protein